jgi:LAO/AO transport system kinase
VNSRVNSEESGANSATSLAQRLVAGDRRVLAKLITQAESSRAEDRQHLDAILQQEAMLRSGAPRSAFRVAFTGPPGAGKSSLIERLGIELLRQSRRFAVLLLDPSSPHSGGSLLGDQTRMPTLSASDSVFIRPSPTKQALGGVADTTALSVALCERAGYDPILIETVGVGQSEVEVARIADCVVLVLLPGAGDELQGMKRGIVETADLIVVNKADIAAQQAEQARHFYEAALSLGSPGTHATSVCTASAMDERGGSELWARILEIREALVRSGVLEKRRNERRKSAFLNALERRFRDGLASPELNLLTAQTLDALARGELSEGDAVQRVWAELSKVQLG